MSSAARLPVLCLFLLAAAGHAQENVQTSHGFALFGGLKYGPDATHHDYVNPDAPKGGTYRFSFSTSFDNLNPL